MSAPAARTEAARVAIAIPCLDDRDLLARHLPAVLHEVRSRGGRDRVLVVDDSGQDVLGPWLREHFAPALAEGLLDVLARPDNGGFARALLDGARRAEGELLFAMNPDIRVHPGFLAPLVAALEDPGVHSAVPRILLFGRAEEVESLTGIAHEADVARLVQPGLSGAPEALVERPGPVAFGVGGALLLRRAPFVEGGGFDPLYEPFYYEDADLGFAAWRAGLEVRYVPASVVEHHHRGSIGKRVDAALVRAVIERNRYLFQWRFLESERAERHLAALYREALDAHLRDEREELVWLRLALDRLEELERARARLGPAVRSYDEVCRISQPGGPGPRAQPADPGAPERGGAPAV